MAPEHPARRLAVIQFADIAGYTALMQQNEQDALGVLARFKQSGRKPLSPRYNIPKMLNFMKASWLFFFCIICFPALNGQNVFGAFSLEHWDTRKGLPTDLILNIDKDNEGYLWLSGYDGLIRFDGHRFSVFDKSTTPELITNSAYGAFMDKKRSFVGADRRQYPFEFFRR